MEQTSSVITGINWVGVRSLYTKEVLRFLRVYNQTLIAPMVNAVLFLAIFVFALGDRVKVVGNIAFIDFMAPGLIMMTMVQNAFANTSSSLIMGKVLGTIIDVLLPPLSAAEVTFSMAMGGVTRGILSGISVAIAISFFADLYVHDWILLLTYSIVACTFLSLLGLIGSIFANSFDQMAAITSYIITPLAFLSGTFYSIKRLPEFWQTVNHFNPFFYMIDGFRYSMTGQADANITTGLIVLTSGVVICYIIAQTLFSKGYRIKS